MFKVNKIDTRRRSGVFIVNFEHISQISGASIVSLSRYTGWDVIIWNGDKYFFSISSAS